MISAFLLQDVPKHDARLFEVREGYKRTLLLGYRAYISAYTAKKIASGGPPRRTSAPPCGVNTLVCIYVCAARPY